jgi:predicted  nucleic acid-binding Zn-ribbon protein
MPTVEEDVQYLIQIVKKDTEIKETKKLIESIPTRIKVIDKEIKRMDEDLAEGKSSLDRLDKERMHLEGDLKAQNEKIKNKKAEERQIKDNKSYRALMAEIEYLTKQVKQEEERMITVLEEVEVRKKAVKALSDRISGERNKLVAEKDHLLGELRTREDAFKILEDEKLRILPHLSEEVRRLYLRILKVKGDSGVANLVGDICQGCFSRVPPQKAHEVRKNNELLTCEVCGRILVYYATHAN